jgi:hypothetical protein
MLYDSQVAIDSALSLSFFSRVLSILLFVLPTLLGFYFGVLLP